MFIWYYFTKCMKRANEAEDTVYIRVSETQMLCAEGWNVRVPSVQHVLGIRHVSASAHFLRVHRHFVVIR